MNRSVTLVWLFSLSYIVALSCLMAVLGAAQAISVVKYNSGGRLGPDQPIDTRNIGDRPVSSPEGGVYQNDKAGYMYEYKDVDGHTVEVYSAGMGAAQNLAEGAVNLAFSWLPLVCLLEMLFMLGATFVYMLPVLRVMKRLAPDMSWAMDNTEYGITGGTILLLLAFISGALWSSYMGLSVFDNGLFSQISWVSNMYKSSWMRANCDVVSVLGGILILASIFLCIWVLVSPKILGKSANTVTKD